MGVRTLCVPACALLLLPFLSLNLCPSPLCPAVFAILRKRRLGGNGMKVTSPLPAKNISGPIRQGMTTSMLVAWRALGLRRSSLAALLVSFFLLELPPPMTLSTPSCRQTDPSVMQVMLPSPKLSFGFALA